MLLLIITVFLPHSLWLQLVPDLIAELSIPVPVLHGQVLTAASAWQLPHGR